METVELVIRMSRESYALIRSGRFYLCGTRGNGKTITSELMESICNGIPLPKGHGRLIDADSMKTMKNIQSANFNAIELIRFWIDNQPTIIEADKEGAEE